MFVSQSLNNINYGVPDGVLPADIMYNMDYYHIYRLSGGIFLSNLFTLTHKTISTSAKTCLGDSGVRKRPQPRWRQACHGLKTAWMKERKAVVMRSSGN